MIMNADKAHIIRLLKLCSMALALVVFSAFTAYAQSPDSTSIAKVDSSAIAPEDSSQSDGGNPFSWTFNHVFQPVLNCLIWPLSAPVHYAFDNGVVETWQDLVTFGERKNILIYPSFNLKPGSSTLVGFNYRHRGVLLQHDYFHFATNYYANSDVYLATRYTKQGIFGLPLFVGTRYTLNWDRDATFTQPDSWKPFVQPDSTMKWDFFLGFPLNSSGTLNLQLNSAIKLVDASVPDVAEDSILLNDKFPVAERGLYQSHTEYPVGLTFVYDDLDYPYAPSRGNRLQIRANYNIVHAYSGVPYGDLGVGGYHENESLDDAGLNHDYISTEVIFQHYFYFGKANNYVMTMKEGRKNRRFYTDFSWEEAVRIWKPENVMETLLERRVIATQFRMNNIFEMEEGGAPFNSLCLLNARYPLRGYAGSLMSKNLVSFSAEYRWPVDRYVEGVIFDEYALYSNELDGFSTDKFVNSWGLGVRVRRPDMYFFRLQFGFHGLQGMNLVLTIAPEYK